MGDKAKNIIVDVLKSDEVKEYLCGLISSHIAVVVGEIPDM